LSVFIKSTVCNHSETKNNGALKVFFSITDPMHLGITSQKTRT